MMRLYVTPSGRWAGTQSDAVKIAREADAGHWQQFEVPTDKPGLLAFLDERRVRAEIGEAPIPDAEIAETAPPPPARAAAPDPAFEAAKARSRSASEIVDFILDEATVGQVENIFQALGTRFAEARP
jgi:hypothetical protein